MLDFEKPLIWNRNPSYDGGFAMPCFTIGDRVLIAVPLSKQSGGGYDIQVIIATEYGWDTTQYESWSDWGWSDVKFYIPLDGERQSSDFLDEEIS